MKNRFIPKKHIISLAVAAAAVAGFSAAKASAAVVTYTWNANATPDNWSNTAEWTSTNGDAAQGAGNIAQYSGATAATATLDTAGVIIGQVQNTSIGDWTIADTGNAITLNNAGGTNNPLADSNAFIGATGAGNLTVNPNIISTAGLDIATSSTGSVTIGVVGTNTITSSTATHTLTLDANGAGNITINSNIAPTGTAFTITNSGTSTGSVMIAGNIGGSGTTVTQNSANSSLTLSGNNNYTGNTTLTAGTLLPTTNTAFGTGKLVLNGGTLSSSSATSALTFANAIQLMGGTTSTITGNQAMTFNGGWNFSNNGNITINNNSSQLVTFAGTSTNPGYHLTIGGTGNTTITANMGNTGPLYDATTGGAVLTLSGNNTMSGGVYLNAGAILALGSSSNLATPVTSGPLGTATLYWASGTSAATASILEPVGDARTIYNRIQLNTGGGVYGINGSNDLTLAGALIDSGYGATFTVNNTGTTTFSGGFNNTSGASMTINGTGNVVFNSVISNTPAFKYTGTGTLTLSASNTNSGGVTVSSGTLAIGSDSVGSPTITSGPVGTGTFTFTGGTTSTAPTTIEAVGGAHSFANAVTLNGTSAPYYQVAGSQDLTLGGLVTNTGNNSPVFNITNTGNTNFTGGINISNSSTNHTLTFSGPGNVNVNSVIANGTSNSGSGLTYSGTGILTLAGANTYSGATTVNSGTVTLNFTSGSVLAGTAVTVGGATTNATLQVTGNNTMGTLTGGSITLAGGDGVTTGQGTLSLIDSAINSLTLANRTTAANNFTVGSASAASILDFEIGATTGVNDSIALGNDKLVLNAGGGIINLTALTSFAEGSYNLLTYAGKSGSGIFTFDGTNATQTIGSETFSLTTGASSTVLNISIASAPIAYFQGATDANWSTNNSGVVNFTSDAAGTTNLGALPGSQTNVHFSSDNATLTGGAVVSNLDSDFTINSLAFDNGSADTIINAGGGTLTINAGTFNSNPLGNGITVGGGAGAVTIAAPIALGASQTWTNNSTTHQLVVSGAISGNGNQLTTVGNIQLAGLNSYSGGTVVSSGTLQLSGSGTLGDISGDLAVNGTLDLNSTSQGVGGLNGSGAILNAGTGTSTLTVGNGGASGSFSGVIEDNAGTGGIVALVKTGAGTQTLTGPNTYTGGTTLTGGGLTGTTTSLIGTIAASNGTLVTFANTADGTFTGNITGGSTAGVTINAPSATVSFTNANDYTGATTVTAGTLKLGDGTNGHDGSFNSTSIVDNGNFNFDNFASQNFTAAISGTGTFAKNAGSTLTFSGATANTYHGALTVYAGTLILGKTGVNAFASGASAAANGGSITVNNGAELQLAGTGNDQMPRWTTVNDNGTFDMNGRSEDFDALDGSGLVTSSVAGPVSLSISHGGSTSTFSGNIQDGAGQVSLSTNNAVNLSGNSTYTGSTTVIYGALTAGTDSTATTGPFGVNSALVLAATSSHNGVGVNINGHQVSVGSLASVGTVPTNVGAVALNGGTLTIGGDNTDTTFIGNITGSVSGTSPYPAVAGAGNIVKIGSGTLSLSGASNNYTGTTTITGGTINITDNGTIGSGAITINGAGARLLNNSTVAVTSAITITNGSIGGSGTFASAVTIGANATVSPGNSPAVQQYAGGQTWASGGTYQWEINDANGSAGVNYDQLAVKNSTQTSVLNVTASAGSPFKIDITGLDATNVSGIVPHFDNGESYAWLIATADDLTGYSAGDFDLLTGNFTNHNSLDGGSFAIHIGTDSVPGVSLDGNANNVFLTFTPSAVPEPASLALLGLGAAALLTRRRRS